MKILFTGAGSGGHFYPIIAVAQEIHTIVREKKLLEPNLYFMAPKPFDAELLFQNDIAYYKSPAGKIRRYFSILNFFDLFTTAWGIVKAVFQVFSIYPDVIFSKGGYTSFPTVLAARLFRIPIVIHESDSVPGKVNLWAGKFATRVAVSYPEAVRYFPKDKVAHTGNPVRKELYTIIHEGASEFLHLEQDIPVILVLGGSQGAKLINEVVIQALPDLVSRFHIIHQTGTQNIEQIKNTAAVILEGSNFAHRYQPFDFLNDLGLRMAAGASKLIITRAGSTLFEVALWEVPCIIIPLTSSGNDHQRKNAYTYARTEAGIVIEEKNLTPHILTAEIVRILDDEALQTKMKASAKRFAHQDAARKIASVLLDIALKHEGP